jgi:hypothetical protein
MIILSILVPTLITIFFVGIIGCFCIKQKYYEDDLKQKTSSYRPLLDDSFSERMV